MNENNQSKNIVFEDENFKPQRKTPQAQASKMVTWVIKHSAGLIKNEKQANNFLIGFIVLSFIISLFLIPEKNELSIPLEELYYGGPEKN